MNKASVLMVACGLSAIISTAAAGQEEEGRRLSVGALGLLYHSPFEVEDTSYLVFPYISYHGDHLYLEGLETGYRFMTPPENGEAALSFDVIVAGRALPGSSRKKITADAGVRIGLHGQLGNLTLTGLRDITDTSNGYEVRAAYSYDFTGEKWFVTPMVAAVWQDKKMANYMWGVTEAQHDRMIDKGKTVLPVYVPDEEVVNYEASLTVGYNLTDRLSLISFISGTYMDKKIRANPGINTRSDFMFGLGASYSF